MWVLASIAAALSGGFCGLCGGFLLGFRKQTSYRSRWREALGSLEGQLKEIDAADARAAAAQEKVRALESGTDAKEMELLRLLTEAERRALMAEQELNTQGYLRPRVIALEKQLTNERAERQRLEMIATAKEEGR